MSDVRTFLMMGRPGSGKGTQARLLGEAVGARVFSSGTALRSVASQDTVLGRKVKQTIDAGVLLPSWYSSFLFVRTLLDLEPAQKVIFEGACRMEPEAVAFDQAAKWLDRPYKAIYLDISEAEVMSRLSKRAGIEGRADDASDSIPKRLSEYNEHTAHVIELFEKEGALLKANGEQTVEAVHADILKLLGTH